MQKKLLHSLFTIGIASLVGFSSCKKDSTIGWDNNTVLETPYNLYAGTVDGWLVQSNDGRVFSSVFGPDGSPIKQITTIGNNVLIYKSRYYISKNNGTNFDILGYTTVNPQPWGNWTYYSYRQNASYMASTVGNGVAQSTDQGVTWSEDNSWVDLVSPNIKVTSFTETDNGTVYGFAPNVNVLFKKENSTAKWTNVVAEGLYPALSNYFLASNGTELFLLDYNGQGGVWYTTDVGAHWFRFNEGPVPMDGSVNYVAAVSNKIGTFAFASTKHAYFISGLTNTVQLADGGLASDITITGMTKKSLKYKDGTTVDYLYLSSDKGIYRSDDNGMTWDKVTSGDFDVNYQSLN